MQRVRAITRKFVLPVACFAGAVWAFAFCFAYMAAPKRDLGLAVLFAFAGIVMSLPWIVIALSVLLRMRRDVEDGETEHHGSGNDARR